VVLVAVAVAAAAAAAAAVVVQQLQQFVSNKNVNIFSGRSMQTNTEQLQSLLRDTNVL